MEWTFFQRQMDRLADTFGKQHYGRERIQLIWQAVRDLSDAWFARTIDMFIGELEKAPLLPKFREEIARERDRSWENQKQKHERESKKFFEECTFPNEEIQNISQTIIRKIKNWDPNRGENLKEEQDYKNYIRILENAANTQKGGSHG